MTGGEWLETIDWRLDRRLLTGDYWLETNNWRLMTTRLHDYTTKRLQTCGTIFDLMIPWLIWWFFDIWLIFKMSDWPTDRLTLVSSWDAISSKQAEKLKSREMKEGWMRNDEEWMKIDEGWRLKDDDFKLLRGFSDRLTEERTDICDWRVAFATENEIVYFKS